MPVHAIQPGRLAVVLVMLSLVTMPGTAHAQGERARNLDGEGVQFFIDPESNARHQADEWRESRPEDAEAILKIADHAQADWFGD